MHCPFCQAEKDRLKVIDSRSCENGRAIRRRRVCSACKKRFTTHERVEQAPRLTVVKGDSSREAWDRNKIIVGLQRAAFKLDVSEQQLEDLADAVEDEALRNHDKEVRSDWIGKHVADRLRGVNEVAYVRFASVYKKFKTPEQFLEEARSAIEARPDGDADGPSLFGDSQPPPPEPIVSKRRRTGRRGGASNETTGAPAPSRRRR